MKLTPGNYKAMMQELAREGWRPATVPTSRRATVTSSTLTCPGRYLALSLHADIERGSVTTTIATIPDGNAAPASWRAAAVAPPPGLWRQAARAAARAAAGIDDAPNPYPGAVLERLGWEHTAHRYAGSQVEHYYHRAHASALTYRRPGPASQGRWSITRNDTIVGIDVPAAEPLALPALVLALALLQSDGRPSR